jgi:alkylation response protein AidB-like acyl-CoA dehydrogenase
MAASEIAEPISFTEFLDSLKKTLKSVFYEKDNIEKFVQKRGFPALVLRDIMARNPLSVAIPKEYGGRGVLVKECLGILDAASYESLPLSLTFGINMALFLEPVGKYGQESIKADLFKRFLTQQNMGGLMITEPDFGSDALSMKMSNVRVGNNYHIKGTKHWQGLTGMADYWLMTSRNKNENGELGRDIDFFVCDVQQSNQQVQVEEYYNNIGLYPIPYGKNIVDVHVPEQFKLMPESTGLKLMMDLLHRSRMQFPGMGIGFIHRLLDEAIKHTSTRIVSGKPLIAFDEVQHQVARIQSAFTIASAMCWKSAAISGIENNLASLSVEANSMKAYITDLMQESAQILTQLLGANGYKNESLGARGIVDSRPFQIFEGSNAMLYTQISEVVLKLMGRKKLSNLAEFVSYYDLTKNIADYFKSILNFTIDINLPQRKMVDLGKILSRLVTAQNVFDMGNKGFRQDLIKDSLAIIKHEISMLASSFKFQTNVTPIEDYKDKSSWLAFC